jgi:DNA invertase Pin-like site-specific DNA recombinase
MARSVDRLGRSLQDLVGFLSELHALRNTSRGVSDVRLSVKHCLAAGRGRVEPFLVPE